MVLASALVDALEKFVVLLDERFEQRSVIGREIRQEILERSVRWKTKAPSFASISMVSPGL